MISYVERLKYEDGNYEWVFPMVVGPRYIPGTPIGKAGGRLGLRYGSCSRCFEDHTAGRKAGYTRRTRHIADRQPRCGSPSSNCVLENS